MKFRLVEEINENLSKKETLEKMDDLFGQKNIYMWSTYILPNGHFLNPTKEKANKYWDKLGEEPEYEHSDFINANFNTYGEYLFDECLKMNVTYPYIALPETKKWTIEQQKACVEILENEDMFVYNNRDIYDRTDGENKEILEMKKPIMISAPFGDKVFDLSIYSPREIIQEINKGYITKSFLNENLTRDINTRKKGIRQEGIDMKFKIVENLDEELIKGKSKRAFDKNVKTEIESGKSPKQAVAIAYSIKNKAEEQEKKKKVKEDMNRDYTLYVSREDNKDRFYMQEMDEDLDSLIEYAEDFVVPEIKDGLLHFAYIMDNSKNTVWDSEKGKINILEEDLQSTQNDIFKKSLDIKEICFDRIRELGKQGNKEEAKHYQDISLIANDIKLLAQDIDEKNELNESAFRIGDKIVKNTEEKPATITSVVGINIVYKDDNDEVVMYNLDKDVDEELFGKIVSYLAEPKEETFDDKDNVNESIDLDNSDTWDEDNNYTNNNFINNGNYNIEQIRQHAQANTINNPIANYNPQIPSQFIQNTMMPNSPLVANSVGTGTLNSQPIQFWEDKSKTPLNVQNGAQNEMQDKNVIDEYVDDCMVRDDDF